MEQAALSIELRRVPLGGAGPAGFIGLRRVSDEPTSSRPRFGGDEALTEDEALHLAESCFGGEVLGEHIPSKDFLRLLESAGR